MLRIGTALKSAPLILTSRSCPAAFTRSSLRAHQIQRQITPASTSRTMTTVQKSESEWKAILSPKQFKILREKGTEPAGTGEYDKHSVEGVYNCGGCGTPLYKSSTKFNSGCGWPAFFDAIPGAVSRHEDRSWFMKRIEITCTACGGHLGHVFQGEGFPTPTDERHCVNSVSLKFQDETSK